MSTDLRETIADDFRRFDGLEEVRILSREDEDGNYADAVTVTALGTRGTQETESLMSAFFPGRKFQVWHVLTDDLEQNMKPRDRIEEDMDDETTRTWEVVAVDIQSLGARQRLTCVLLVD